MSIGPESQEPHEASRPEQQPPAPATPPADGQPLKDRPAPPVSGYSLRPPMRPEEEKLWAIGAHLGPIVVGVLAPLVVWLVFRDRSGFLDRTGKEALNMQISYLIYFAVAGISIFVLIGLFLLPLVGLAWLVLMIVPTVKVANFEDFRYPAIIRFIS